MAVYHIPKVFKIAETKVNMAEIEQLMLAIDANAENGTAHDWLMHGNHSPDHAAMLVEIAGRMCYKSFGLGLNANLTKTREDPKEYVGNILATHHGSVLEHPSVTFALIGVSRVVTHELVRHRAGTGFSQESMRFVQIESIRFYYPKAFQDELSEEVAGEVDRLTQEMLRVLEQNYKKLANLLLADPDMPFTRKKKITSAMRRLLPDGILTDIVMTANHRAWRHIIEVRTSEGAEEEIQLVVDMITERLIADHPFLYQDLTKLSATNWAVRHSKI
jgi:thymidylate synthase (FAD)